MQRLRDNDTALTSLDLSRNDIGAAGAKGLSLALKDNRTLTSLNLYGNQIGAAGAKDVSLALKDNRTLTSLDLISNQIGDAGAKALSRGLRDNHTLIYLNLSHNQIGDAGAKALSRGLKDNRTLATLVLSSNQIGNAGANDLSLMLKDNHTLTSLRLHHNEIGDSKAKKQIERSLTHNKELIIQRRDQFIQAMVILARDSANPQSQSFLSWLPKDIFFSIFQLIDFRSDESIGKSAAQIYHCAKFIFGNISFLSNLLSKGQGLKIIENVANNKSHFRFFQQKPQAISPESLFTTEETIESKNTSMKPANRLN